MNFGDLKCEDSGDSTLGIPKRRLSFGYDVGRQSFDDLAKKNNAIVQTSVGGEEKAAKNKDVRRRRSFDQILAFSADGGTSSLLKEVICGAFGMLSSSDGKNELSAKEKMDTLLIRAKRKGVGAEKLFQYFDCNNDHIITAKEVRNGLSALDPILFRMSAQEIDTVVDIFDSNHDGTINMKEFEDYCLSLPDPSWKAERLRRERQATEEEKQLEEDLLETPQNQQQQTKNKASYSNKPTRSRNNTKQNHSTQRPFFPTLSTAFKDGSFNKMTASASAKQKLLRKSSIDQSTMNPVFLASGTPKASFK